MDEIRKAVSSLSFESNDDDKIEVMASPPSDDDRFSAFNQIVIHNDKFNAFDRMNNPDELSPASTSSAGSQHSKSGLVQALDAARRKKAMNSPPGSVDSLSIPSLEESRNDQERRRQIDTLVQINSHDEGLEVSLTCKDDQSNNSHHSYYDWPTSPKSDPGGVRPRMSDLAIKAEKILLEARLASVDSFQSPGSVASNPIIRDHIVQQALDRAAAQSKAAAAQALETGLAITKSDPGVGGSYSFSSTEDIWQAASLSFREEKEREMQERQSSPSKSPDFSPSHARPPMPYRNMKSSMDTHPENPASPLSQTLSPSPKCLSPTESDIASIDDYEKAVNRLPSRLIEDNLPEEKLLRRIDGVIQSPVDTSDSLTNSPSSPDLNDPITPILAVDPITMPHVQQDSNSIASGVDAKKAKTVVIKSASHPKHRSTMSDFSWLDFFWKSRDTGNAAEDSDSLLMSCGSHAIRPRVGEELPSMQSSIIRVASGPQEPQLEALSKKTIDPRMPDWVDHQFSAREEAPSDGTYQLGASRTVIVHEIMRGSWTWATEWSPDGDKLAIATENHHLAVIETCSSSVWRVKHDKRVKGPARQDTVHSIRAIAWGTQFIAIGGTGNAVSILAPTEPYPILHTMAQTGFVGSLHWLKGSNTLLIGSRLGKALVVKITVKERGNAIDPHHREITSTVIHTVDRQRAWVNAVKFSPGGKAFAVGDSFGILGVYSYEEVPGRPLKITNITNFKLDDSILDLDWSPSGEWLYAGGEDFAVTVIGTQWWEAVHRIKRDRWVQFITSSLGGSHVAVGGVSSEVSILDVERGWDTAINVSLKGLVPLSAKWHPQDQYLVLTGQNNSVLAVETTNARYVSGHFLRSVSPISAIEFSPDGHMAAIGNEAGIVTIFKLSGSTFITCYELVLDCDGTLSIDWSMNGAYLAVSSGNKIVVVARSEALHEKSPPNTSGFSIAKVIRDVDEVQDVAIDPKSRYLAASGKKTRILDADANFACIHEMENSGITLANSWSPDGKWFATAGKNQSLLIYDTWSEDSSQWQPIFTVQTKQPLLSFAWGPAMLGGLQYCAYGGEDKKVYIMEIRNKERTWETVLGIPRDAVVHDLDWNGDGLVAAAIGNGTVTVMDLSYLQSGWAVNEMDYNWQRQALTCFTEIRRNKGKNCMRNVRWIPGAPGSDCLLAVGGTDGEIEIIDLTERKRCSGFKIAAAI